MKSLPEYHIHTFRLNESSKYFQKLIAPVGFIKLPSELKLESPFRQSYKSAGVKFILRSRVQNGSHTFFTGLIPTGTTGYYYGDHFHKEEKKDRSFCVVYISPSSTDLTIYYFNHIVIYPKYRSRFIQTLLNEIG